VITASQLEERLEAKLHYWWKSLGNWMLGLSIVLCISDLMRRIEPYAQQLQTLPALRVLNQSPEAFSC
jgi:hypothetical protein